MDFIKRFNQISKLDASIAGGKGASLGEMTQAGITVPPGFVILANAFEKFLEETDLNVEIDSILHSVNTKEMHTIENASEKIKDLILKAKMPKDISEEIKKEFKNLNAEFVAVRSSATAEDSSSAAWAGQLDSFLNTTEKTLLANVQKCWASLFTPRAIFYRFEKGLHSTKISVAVVAQKMVESEVSGIAFSVHPVTQDINQIIIEAGYGLGEAIVSGQITPDSYVVEKKPRRIIDKNVSVQERGIYRKLKGGGNEWQDIPQEKGEWQKLTDEQILELSEIVIKIEKHYGVPQDIEWVCEKNKFYITQSRPITTLDGKKLQKTKLIKFGTRPTKSYAAAFFVYLNFDIHTNRITKTLKCSLSNLIGYYNGENIIFFALKNDLDKIKYNFLKFVESKQFYIEFKKAKSAFEDLIDAVQTSKNKKNIQNKFNIFTKLSSFYTAVSFVSKFWYKDLSAKYQNKFIKISDEFKTLVDNFNFYDSKILISYFRKRNNLLAKDKKWIKKKFIFSGGKFFNENLEKFFDRNNFEYQDVVPVANRKDTDILNGISGLPGIITGRVIIVFGIKDLKKVKGGDILVTPMTKPIFAPIFSKIKAIITDEGGILTHAVIVAREFNIPCIISTKIATKVLRDGDLVEVDADKGVVRILERAK